MGSGDVPKGLLKASQSIIRFAICLRNCLYVYITEFHTRIIRGDLDHVTYSFKSLKVEPGSTSFHGASLQACRFCLG